MQIQRLQEFGDDPQSSYSLGVTHLFRFLQLELARLSASSQQESISLLHVWVLFRS